MEDTSADLLQIKAMVVIGWLLLLFVLERAMPAAMPPDGDGRWRWRRLLRNAGLWLVNIGLSPLIVIPISVLAGDLSLGWRPDWWAGWPALLLDLLVLDLLIYWWHRANHVIPFLWRFHEIHHLDHFLDTTSAVRFHFGEVLLSALARAVIIVLLGIPLVSVVIFEAVVLLAAVFHHSNLRLPARLERAISRVIVTPSIHWVHHHAIRSDTDSNYGTLFSFWDPIFGSRSRTVRTPDMPIGVEKLAELSLPQLVIRPFRLRRRS